MTATGGNGHGRNIRTTTGRNAMKAKNLTMQRFGRLTAIVSHNISKSRHRLWKCICECGEYREVLSHRLLSGGTASCGCLQQEQASKTHYKHGNSGYHPTQTYRCWKSMKARCNNHKDKGFKDYGGRGIAICDRWMNSFEAFLMDMGEKPQGLELDRIDVNGNYEPGNCRWATERTQSINQRKQKNNTSGYIGVGWNSDRGKWMARITSEYRYINLGRFDDKEAAARAYDIGAKKYHGEFAKLNFPPEKEAYREETK